MVLENPCPCGCKNSRCRRRNISSQSDLREPLNGFQSYKRTCNVFPNKSKPFNTVYSYKCPRKKCITNRLDAFSALDMYQTARYNSFSMLNTDCRCKMTCNTNPNLKYIQRQIPVCSKNQCCNICFPDALANAGWRSSRCPPTDPNWNCNGQASFLPTQNRCLCMR